MDAVTYKKSVQYTLTKARFGTVSDSYSTAVLCTLLFSGLLASLFAQVVERTGPVSMGTGHRAVGSDPADVAAKPAVFMVVAVST